MSLSRWVRRQGRRWLPESLKETILVHTRYQRLRKGEEWGLSLRPFDELRCIFVHIPKTGGVSVAKGLFGNHGGSHIPIRVHRRIFGKRLFGEYFKFAFVRNPWDRLVSAYAFLKKGGMDKDDRRFADEHAKILESFETFVREGLVDPAVLRHIHLVPQTEWLTIDGRIAADFVGRFEKMGDDFREVCRRLGRDVTLPHHNASRHRDYRTCYDDATAARVGEVYRTDVEAFGYSFEVAVGGERSR